MIHQAATVTNKRIIIAPGAVATKAVNNKEKTRVQVRIEQAGNDDRCFVFAEVPSTGRNSSVSDTHF